MTDRAEGGQEVLHEITDYQSNAHVGVCVEDVTQVHVRGVEGLSVSHQVCLTDCSVLSPWEMHSRWSCPISVQLALLTDVLGKNSWKGRCDKLQGIVCISHKTTWACSVLFFHSSQLPWSKETFCCQIQLAYSTGKIQALPGPAFEGTVLDHVSVDWLLALLHGYMKEMGGKERNKWALVYLTLSLSGYFAIAAPGTCGHNTFTGVENERWNEFIVYFLALSSPHLCCIQTAFSWCNAVIGGFLINRFLSCDSEGLWNTHSCANGKQWFHLK